VNSKPPFQGTAHNKKKIVIGKNVEGLHKIVARNRGPSKEVNLLIRGKRDGTKTAQKGCSLNHQRPGRLRIQTKEKKKPLEEVGKRRLYVL